MPLLSNAHKVSRLKFCLSHVNHKTGRFHPMLNVIHIDEKWFDISKVNQNYYVLPNEKKPHRTCISKSHLPRVMFFAAVGVPQWDTEKKTWWDGRVGIWPFVETVPEERASKNRPKGTPVLHGRKVTQQIVFNSQMLHIYNHNAFAVLSHIQDSSKCCVMNTHICNRY